jgi:hypothetical protein
MQMTSESQDLFVANLGTSAGVLPTLQQDINKEQIGKVQKVNEILAFKCIKRSLELSHLDFPLKYKSLQVV